jgi:hypothetical protein
MSQAYARTAHGQAFRRRVRRLEYTLDELVILRRKQHRQHVIDRRELMTAGMAIKQCQIAEMPVGVGDLHGEGFDQPHLLRIGLRHQSVVRQP